MHIVARIAVAALVFASACKPNSSSGGSGATATQVAQLGVALNCANGDKLACENQFADSEKRCNDGDGEGCVLQGLNYENARVVAVDEVKATTYFARSCTLNDGVGCWYESRQYAYGRGATKDAVHAADLCEQGCTLGAVNGCYDLGAAYRDGNGRPKDLHRAHDAFAKACGLGKLKTGSGCKDAHDLEADAQP